ncbi:hypothetical protein A3C86_04750 [Candidatus Kaiserbacteria bacterium RIFCSPHIGHO2_02_FULL_49_16]|uniref:Uncharacterized protein n=1 Tax=Candidatus Kaiserbacteria bacterium RIFCSPHIGHO2_02_FULL_49_16 TaxID=1798490 RepID=A0A1F6DAU7_9BACT|nr:MAG: hypothetical protein A3C86_04750 [Candidatus Kaiserbacteria bacterium RIFCSPHIGHO2_02_FULL_49_16]
MIFGRLRPQPQGPVQKDKPRSFYYEDKEGAEHSLQGELITPQALSENEPRSFWYTDPKGVKHQIDGARSWWHEDPKTTGRGEKTE